MSAGDLLEELESFEETIREDFGDQFVETGWGGEDDTVMEVDTGGPEEEVVEDRFVVYGDGRIYAQADPTEEGLQVSGVAIDCVDTTRDKELRRLADLVENDSGRIDSYAFPIEPEAGEPGEIVDFLGEKGVERKSISRSSYDGEFYSVDKETAEEVLERTGVTSFRYTGPGEWIADRLSDIQVDGYTRVEKTRSST